MMTCLLVVHYLHIINSSMLKYVVLLSVSVASYHRLWPAALCLLGGELEVEAAVEPVEVEVALEAVGAGLAEGGRGLLRLPQGGRGEGGLERLLLHLGPLLERERGVGRLLLELLLLLLGGEG